MNLHSPQNQTRARWSSVIICNICLRCIQVAVRQSGLEHAAEIAFAHIFRGEDSESDVVH